jgi:NAD-dependent dihydropyrimidine dehydrogenase PreA subunit
MIFYLSCTGNTKWAAKEVANLTADGNIISIPEAIKNNSYRFALQEGERIGFCFPVHGWRPPKLVREFISKLVIDGASNAYTYAICTAGDDIGETIDIFNADIKKRGLHLDAALSLIMPESYVGLPFMNVDKPEKEKQKRDKAKEELTSFARNVILKNEKAENLARGNWPRINSRLLGGFFIHKLITDKPFRVKTDSCIKCGICASVCPVDNIDGGKDKMPVWKHTGDCLACFACYHHCPNHAIEYGKRTKNKGQYFYH